MSVARGILMLRSKRVTVAAVGLPSLGKHRISMATAMRGRTVVHARRPMIGMTHGVVAPGERIAVRHSGMIATAGTRHARSVAPTAAARSGMRGRCVLLIVIRVRDRA